MDLTKIKNDIPKAVTDWAKYKYDASKQSKSFVSVISYRYGEIVERAFAVREYAKKGVMITEVRRRATGRNSPTIIKNVYFTKFGGYIPVFKKTNRYQTWRGYCIYTYFNENDFDKWYETDNYYYNFECICLNKNILTDIAEFKYCGYSGGDIIKYLNEYRKNSMIEYFGKLDLPISHLLISQLEKDDKFKTFIFKNIADVRCYGSQATVHAYKNGLSIREAATKIQRKKYIVKHIPALKGKNVDFERIFSYCNDNKIKCPVYNDYIEAVIALKLNLNDTKNIYPKNFKEMHDLRIMEYESQKAKDDRKSRKELYKSFAKAGEKATAYEYSKNGLSMVAPRDISDLKIEGKILHHCVGKMGYDKKMADNEIVIMFVRKTDNPNEPFVTIEFDLKSLKVKQAYGDENTNPPNEVMIFINEWVVIMQKLLKKERKKAK